MVFQWCPSTSVQRDEHVVLLLLCGHEQQGHRYHDDEEAGISASRGPRPSKRGHVQAQCSQGQGRM